jgi:HK97 family phage major capsid protein
VAEVNRFTLQYGVARRDMRYMPFSGAGNSRTIPLLDSSVSVFWVGEAGAKPSTKPAFGYVTQTLKKIAAIVPMTEELLEDSAIDIIALLGELFGEAVAMEEDRVFFAGNTGSGDPFNGVINASGVVPTLLGSGDDANDLNADDLLDLIGSVPPQIQKNGKFYMHSSILRCIQKLKSTVTGNYIWQGPVGGQPGTIWNRPYETVDVLPDSTLTTHSAPYMFYTDLKKTCVYGDKGGLKVKLLDQGIVQSADESPSDLNLSTQDMVALRIVKRVGYVPLLPAGIAVLKVASA